MYVGNAVGDYLPTMVINKAAHVYMQWTMGAPQGCEFDATESGWFNGKAVLWGMFYSIEFITTVFPIRKYSFNHRTSTTLCNLPTKYPPPGVRTFSWRAHCQLSYLLFLSSASYRLSFNRYLHAPPVERKIDITKDPANRSYKAVIKEHSALSDHQRQQPSKDVQFDVFGCQHSLWLTK